MKNELLRLGVILGLLSSVGPFAIDVYLPALPIVAEDLGASVSATQVTLLTFLVAFGSAQIVYGPLADRFGRKPPLILGTLIFIAGSLGCVFAPSIEWLTAARFVQGAGASALMVVPRAIVRDRLTGTDATRLMARIMLVISVSPMFAPLVGSGLMLIGSWRLIFAILCLVALTGLLLTVFALPETLRPGSRTSMNFSSLLRASGTLLRHREFVLLTSIGSIGLASFFVFIASAPFVYAEQYELSPARFSITFAINALGFFAASQFAAPLGERFGLDLLISSAALGFAVLNSILFVLVYLEFDSLVIVVGTLFLANTFLGVIIPTTMVMALEDQGEIAGLASSLSGAIQWLAGGLVIAIAGPFFDGTVLPMVASIAICALVVVYLSVFVARSPERQH